MSLAALSTSVIASNVSPAPAATTPQAASEPQVFANLVARAKSDDQAQQEGARPESPVETAADNAAADEADVTTPKDEAGEVPVEGPVNLLAEIEAMVAAASQLGIGQPVAVPGTPAPAILPAAVKGGLVATAPSTPAPPVPPFQVSKAAAPILAAPVAAAAKIIPPEGEPISSGKAPGRGVTTLIASLKSAFQSAESEESAAEIKSAKAATPSAINAAGIPAKTVALTDAILVPIADEAAVAPGSAPAEASADATVTTIMAERAPVLASEMIRPEADAPVASALAQAIDDVATPTVLTEPIPIPTSVTATSGAEAIVAADTEQATMPAAPAPKAMDIPAAASDRQAEFPVAESQPVSASAGRDAAPPPADDDTAAPVSGERTDSAAPPNADSASEAAVTPPLPASPPGVSTAPAAEAAVGEPATVDQSVDRQLELVRDHQWLDRLARDISQATNQQGHLRFQLNPEHLGALTVELTNSASGTSIRLTAETDQARAIIADAQPRLLAEVRAQGLRIAESHVDLNQQGGGSSGSAHGQQQSSADHKPFARTQAAVRDEAGDSAPRDDDGELYA